MAGSQFGPADETHPGLAAAKSQLNFPKMIEKLWEACRGQTQ